MRNRDNVNIILLAAGNSRRFGNNKLLTEFEGKPLFQYTFDVAVAVSEWLIKNKVDNNIIIVSQYGEVLSAGEKSGCMAIENNKPELGISYSIKLALNACGKIDDRDNKDSSRHNVDYMFFVCDQPLLRSESAINLVSSYRNSHKPMGCLAYKNRLGNPCIFNSKYVPDLLQLEGDDGGKKIILLNPDNTLTVESYDEKELLDIDNMEDFNKLSNDLRK